MHLEGNSNSGQTPTFHFDEMLTTTILRTILRFSMVRRGDRVLVGLSGGADSVALTHALFALRTELEIHLVIAHLNHGLRDDAAADEGFCRELAGKLGVAFVVGRTDVTQKATSEKRSIEDAGRAARYAFFAAQAERHQCHRIATGHTMDDQAETLLMRLTRGSGTRGLASVYPVMTPGARSPELCTTIATIRPLIDVRRHEIEAFVAEQGLSYREDPSNRDRRFTRNRLRHDVLPRLVKELNPRLVATLARTAEILRDDEDFMDKRALEAFDRAATRSSAEIRLSISALADSHPALRRRVARLAVEHIRGDTRDLSMQHVRDLLGLLEPGKSGREVHLPGVVVERSFDELLLFPKSARRGHDPSDTGYNSFEYRLAIPAELPIRECRGLLTAHLVESIRVSDQPGAAAGNAVDVGVEDGIAELHVRSPRPSDRFRPLGAPGSKPLVRYLMERKVAKRKRRHVPLVVRVDDEILWVAGHSVSETARLGPGRRRLHLEWMGQ